RQHLGAADVHARGVEREVGEIGGGDRALVVTQQRRDACARRGHGLGVPAAFGRQRVVGLEAERIDGVPGVVTLVVLPAYDPLQPDQPTPDKEMLRRVCAHLEPRRLVTTELYVT